MANWPSIQISAPADSAQINLAQTGPTTIDCQINQNGYRDLVLTSCAASSDCLTLTAQTTWLFFTVNVSIDLALVNATEATATINADGAPTVHQISMADFVAAKAFIANCRLPAISPLFTVGRTKEPHP